MTIYTKIRGHKVTTTDGTNWYYDDGVLYEKNDRACTECGICVSHDSPDPCLGFLDGVSYACCGHGDDHYEYVATPSMRYNSVEAWRLDTERGTINPRQNQREV